MRRRAGRARLARALRVAGAARAAPGFFDELAARYGEPARRHHTLDHVLACLAGLDRFAACAVRPHEVELALWLHDVVYDPRRDDNEQRSAALARERLGAAGVPGDAIARIAGRIEATRHHEAHDADGALVNDLDLAILGENEARFDRFEREIREEYAHVPEALYREGRRRVLASFHTRPAIYRTPAIRAEREAVARDNLQRRIRELREGSRA